MSVKDDKDRFSDKTGESIPWREAFPEPFENQPGVILAGARGKEDLTQKQLSKLSGISVYRISEMERNKRPITEELARLFGKVLNIDYRVFLDSELYQAACAVEADEALNQEMKDWEITIGDCLD